MKPKNNRIYTPPLPPAVLFAVRVELEDGRIEEIGSTNDLEEAVATAWTHHASTGRKTFVFNTQNGRTIQRVERGRAAGQGGGR